MSKREFDAIIVGGGVSGSTTAAALARKGWRVLVCEAGLPSSKRLAGELMHPPAAQRLQDLGLLEPLQRAGAIPTYGFAVFEGPQDSGTILSYSEVTGARPTSVAVEHSTMTRALLTAVEGYEGVTVWRGARVLSVDFSGTHPVAMIRERGATPREVGAELIVSAEGREAPIRQQAGIDCQRGAPFRMVGWKIPSARLPYPGYGHVFLGGPTATLAYQISRTDTRIMFELDVDGTQHLPTDLVRFSAQSVQGGCGTGYDELQAPNSQGLRSDAQDFCSEAARGGGGLWGMCASSQCKWDRVLHQRRSGARP